MILSNEEVNSRLSSSENLLNRLRKITKSDIPSIPNSVAVLDNNTNIPSIPGVEELVESIDDKINTAKSFSKAKQVLANTLERLDQRLIEVDKPTDLCKIAEGMGKLINGFDENKKGDMSKAPVIIWKPVMNTEVNYGESIQSEL